MTALIVTLIIAGLLLLGAELIIIPGFGIAGILGIASVMASCWLAFVQIGTTAGIITIIANITLIVITTIIMLRSKTWKKLSLNTNIESKVDTAPADKGIEIGSFGITVTRLAPGGKVQIGENTLEAFTRDTIIEPGKKIQVISVDGYKIYVKETN